MKRHHIIQNLIAICVATGCTLEEPCQNDEIYSAGSCIKCRDYGDHHIGADGYCVKDTIEACGEGLTNCREIEGASDVGCIHGKCQILRCDDSRGYEFDNNRCIQGEAFSCGTDRINCVSDWLPKVYADQSWTAGSTPLCAEGQCMIGTCAPGYEHIRCADYIDRYAADYKKEYGESFSIPLCESASNQDTTICLKYICPLSGSSLQKAAPGACGCELAEDTDDDDYDGIINCLDACPNNPSKSDKNLWWDKEAGTGIRCDIWDTDHDGVDDDEDICPTRESIQSVSDFSIEELAKYDLITDGAPDKEKIAKISNIKHLELCGILVENEFDTVYGYHIYNAKDLTSQNLSGLYSSTLYSGVFCTTGNESCNQNILTKCVNSVNIRYSCSECIIDPPSAATCEEQTYIPIEPRFRVFLENDINLDDHNIKTIISTNKHTNDGSSASEKFECYGLWEAIPRAVAIEFDGKGHTIYYRRYSDDTTTQRCNLMDALFAEISYSTFKNFTIDFDMNGYGHALLTNHAYSSQFSDITVRQATLETSIADSGIGTLVGNAINLVQPSDAYNRFSNINISHLTLSAPNAQRVGGLVGNAEDKIVYDGVHLSDMTIQGTTYTGGLVGNAEDKIVCDGIHLSDMTIQGTTYTGGLAGYSRWISGQNIELEDILINGESYTGGFIGYTSGVEGIDLLDTNLDNITVHGKDNTGGLVGYANKIALSGDYTQTNSMINGNNNTGGIVGRVSRPIDFATDSFKIEHGTITGNDYVGGVFGQGRILEFNELSVNLGRISGNNSIGGFAGEIGSWCPPQSNSPIVNRIAEVSGNDHVGGFAGSLSIGCAPQNKPKTGPIWLYNIIGKVTGTGKSIGGMAGEIKSNPYVFLSYIYNKAKEVSGDNAVGGMFGTMSGVENELYQMYNYVGSVTANSGAGGFIGEIYSKQSYINTIHHIMNDVQHVQTTYAVENDLPKYTGGFIGTVRSAVLNLSLIENKNALIEGTDRVGGLLGYYENSQESSGQCDAKLKLDYVHSQADVIHGIQHLGSLIGYFSVATRPCGNVNFEISDVTSYAVLPQCDAENNDSGLGAQTSLPDTFSRAFFATFSEKNKDHHYGCDSVIGKGNLDAANTSSVFWYSPEDPATHGFAPFGPNTCDSPLAERFDETTIDRLLSQLNFSHRTTEFTYGGTKLKLPTAMSLDTIEHEFVGINNSYTKD